MLSTRVGTIILISLLSLSVFGCSGVAPSVADISNQKVAVQEISDLTLNISIDDVAEIMKDDSVVILDVREDYEYAEGHIPGAELLPLGQIPRRLDEIPTDVPVILVCRSGNRSSQALSYLQDQGFANIHNMLGGMLDWADAGYDIVK